MDDAQFIALLDGSRYEESAARPESPLVALEELVRAAAAGDAVYSNVGAPDDIGSGSFDEHGAFFAGVAPSPARTAPAPGGPDNEAVVERQKQQLGVLRGRIGALEAANLEANERLAAAKRRAKRAAPVGALLGAAADIRLPASLRELVLA